MGKFISAIEKIIEDDINCDTNGALAQAILAYGSNTQDNQSCTSNLAVVASDTYKGVGLLTGVLLSELINSAEGCLIPEQVRNDYPELTQSQWDAALRICTLLLTDVERNFSKVIQN
ncbi:MAG: hypothetical protein HWE27_00700 [Gammaproteobacteria bacterium]|nr:hypothetical protein [Gammaproteobacteria bacterium]